MTQLPYSVAEASGDDIIPIVDKIHKAISGETFPNATMALLFTIFTISYPEISNENLKKGIKDASEHICLLLDSFEHPLDKDPDARMKFN